MRGAALLLLGSLVLLGAPAVAPEDREPQLCLTVLDVGQGDALLVSLPGGERWLVDGGGVRGGGYDVGRYKVLPALRRLGVDRLDRVFVTHGDADHFEGLFAVLAALPVGELWVPTRRSLSARMGALVADAERLGVPLRVVDEGAVLPAAPRPVRAQLLHPWPGWAVGEADEATGSNDGSIVLRVALGDVAMLLTGDIEAPAEERLAEAGRLAPAAVLKVPHHGSKTSSTPALLDRVRPLVAVAGAGADNRYGFPHASVAARYGRAGAPLYWTGRHGALRVCTDGWSIHVEQAGESLRWSSLRRWSVDEVAGWSAESVEAPVLQPVAARCEVPERGRRRTRARGASKSKRKPKSKGKSKGKPKAKSTGSASASPTPPPGPEAPSLAPDREWERARRTRGRLKAPWKGR